MPSIEVVSPSCTIDGVVSKTCCIDGSVGRYMSVTKGPKAVSMPRKTTRKMK